MATNQITVPMLVNAPVATVWAALTSSRSEWWPGLIFEPMVGSPVIEKWVEDGALKKALGMITAVQLQSLIIFKWGQPTWGDTMEVEIRLNPENEEATNVLVTETGFDKIDAAEVLPEDHEAGWRYHLEQLRDYCQK